MTLTDTVNQILSTNPTLAYSAGLLKNTLQPSGGTVYQIPENTFNNFIGDVITAGISATPFSPLIPTATNAPTIANEAAQTATTVAGEVWNGVTAYGDKVIYDVSKGLSATAEAGTRGATQGFFNGIGALAIVAVLLYATRSKWS